MPFVYVWALTIMFFFPHYLVTMSLKIESRINSLAYSVVGFSTSATGNVDYFSCSNYYVSKNTTNESLDGVPVSLNTTQNNYNQSHEVGSSSAQNGLTTTDVVVGESVIAQPLNPMALPSSLNSTDTGVVQDIKSFLAKPRRIIIGNLSAADTSTSLPSQKLFSDILNSAIYTDKIRGHIGFKATTVLKLMCNANMFQQGRYIMAFVPGGGMDTTSTYWTNYYNAHRYSLVQITQLPHVELDIACESEVTLKIPFMSAEPCFSLAGLTTPGLSDTGVVFLCPYVALSSATGTTTASYSVWVHFEDVELFGPTVPQSEWKVKSKKKKSPSAVEQEQVNGGPISGPLIAVSNAAAALSKIPILSPYAGLTAWATEILSNTAAAFGFSKPSDISHIMRVNRYVMPFMANDDGVDNGTKLALSSKHGVDLLPGLGGVDIDEMNLAYIASIPAFLQRFDMSDSGSSGDLLASITLNPWAMYVGTTDAGLANVLCYPPLSYVATAFANFRGSIGMRIKIVKTNFHSGRIIAAYFPQDNRFPVVATTIASTDYAHRAIIDIREGNEFTILFPYVNPVPYITQFDSNSLGTVKFYTLDPLTRPSSVSSTINFLIEIFGGPDVEFAVPYELVLPVITPTAPQSEWRPTCGIIDQVVGGASVIVSEDNIHARMMVGEKITTCRALMKRTTLVSPVTFPTDVSLVIYPYFLYTYLSGGGASTHSLARCDPITYWTSCFCFNRGGMRYKIETTTNSVSSTQMTPAVAHIENMNSSMGASDAYVTPGSLVGYKVCVGAPTQVFYPNVSGAIEVEVPSYNVYQSRCTGEQTFTGSVITSQYKHYPQIKLVVEYGASCTSRIWRGAADDYQLAGFVSTPPTYTTIF